MRHVGGLLYEFTRRVVDYYEEFDRDNTDRPNIKACRNGYCYEAHVAESIFHKMLAAEEPRIHFRLQHQLQEAIVEDGRLTAVTLTQRTQPERLIRCRAKVFVDATYEGDVHDDAIGNANYCATVSPGLKAIASGTHSN